MQSDISKQRKLNKRITYVILLQRHEHKMVKMENNGYGYFCDTESLDVYEEKPYIIEIREKRKPKSKPLPIQKNTSLSEYKEVWKHSVVCISICVFYLYIVLS